ncbi:MAG: hypothetical protein ACRDFB_05180 [Rhabdochlamydiaceae bacterium]
MISFKAFLKEQAKDKSTIQPARIGKKAKRSIIGNHIRVSDPGDANGGGGNQIRGTGVSSLTG